MSPLPPLDDVLNSGLTDSILLGERLVGVATCGIRSPDGEDSIFGQLDHGVPCTLTPSLDDRVVHVLPMRPKAKVTPTDAAQMSVPTGVQHHTPLGRADHSCPELARPALIAKKQTFVDFLLSLLEEGSDFGGGAATRASAIGVSVESVSLVATVAEARTWVHGGQVAGWVTGAHSTSVPYPAFHAVRRAA